VLVEELGEDAVELPEVVDAGDGAVPPARASLNSTTSGTTYAAVTKPANRRKAARRPGDLGRSGFEFCFIGPSLIGV